MINNLALQLVNGLMVPINIHLKTSVDQHTSPTMPILSRAVLIPIKFNALLNLYACGEEERKKLLTLTSLTKENSSTLTSAMLQALKDGTKLFQFAKFSETKTLAINQRTAYGQLVKNSSMEIMPVCAFQRRFNL
jgi:hypothetical protein